VTSPSPRSCTLPPPTPLLPAVPCCHRSKVEEEQEWKKGREREKEKNRGEKEKGREEGGKGGKEKGKP